MANPHNENINLLVSELQEPYKNFAGVHFTRESYLDMRNKAPTLQPISERFKIQIIKNEILEGICYARQNSKNANLPALILFHGGGFIMGGPEFMQTWSIETLEHIDCIVFTPKFRFTPENPFPAQLEDAKNALLWIAQHPLVDRSKIAVGGNSTGGTLAAGLALMTTTNSNLPKLSAVLLDGPCLSRSISIPDEPLFEKFGSLHNSKTIVDWYTPQESHKQNAEAYPLQADSLHGFPATILGLPQFDILKQQGVEFAQRLWKESTNGCELHVWKGTIHGGGSLSPTASVYVRARSTYIMFLKDIWKDPLHKSK